MPLGITQVKTSSSSSQQQSWSFSVRCVEEDLRQVDHEQDIGDKFTVENIRRVHDAGSDTLRSLD